MTFWAETGVFGQVYNDLRDGILGNHFRRLNQKGA